MKALRKLKMGYGNMELMDLDIPKLENNEILVRVAYVGICGTDIHNYKGEYTKTIPLTLGHEFSGTVEMIGSEVVNFKIGDPILSETSFNTCNTCSHCLNKEYNLCDFREGIGTQIDGAFADFVVVKEKHSHHIPASIPLNIAALGEPLACCVHAAIEKTTVIKDELVAIYGPGPIGLLMLIVLKSLGARVVMIGTPNDAHRLELAKTLGADFILNTFDTDFESQIKDISNSEGISQIFECSGNINAVHQAFSIIKKKGKIIQEGLFNTSLNPINMDHLIHKEIEYIGSRTQKPSSWVTAIDIMEHNTDKLSKLITNVLPLNEWQVGFDLVMSGSEIKVLLKP